MAQQEIPFLVLNQDKGSSNYGMVEVKGVPESFAEKIRMLKPSNKTWKKIFRVYTGSKKPTDPAKPCIIGDYYEEKATFFFKPRFYWVDDLSYYAELDLNKLYALVSDSNPYKKTSVSLSFQLTKEKRPATYITKVYPQTEVLPANLLKMYVYFSAPMSRRQSKKYVKIVDAKGNTVPHVFLPIKEELWNRNRTRLTLFFDPGRIKRGLRPHNENGTPLQPNRQYSIVIDAQWKDAYGNKLKSNYTKKFKTTSDDRIKPKPFLWKLTIPAARTQMPLQLESNGTLDHALVKRYLVLKKKNGKNIKGTFELHKDDQTIQFTPAKAWKWGDYTIEVDNRLEDLAGNNLRQLFDIDMNNQKSVKKDQKPTKFTFTITKPANN